MDEAIHLGHECGRCGFVRVLDILPSGSGPLIEDAFVRRRHAPDEPCPACGLLAMQIVIRNTGTTLVLRMPPRRAPGYHLGL